MSDQGSFAVGQMHAAEGERFVVALDRQGQMDVVQTLRSWVRERLDIRPGATVLDVGCGTGEELIRLAHLAGEAGRAVGVDANEPMLAIARERTAAVPTITIDDAEASDLPYATGSADALVSERVLQHLPYDPSVAVTEFARVIKPSGLIGLTDTDWSSLQVLVTDDASASAQLQSIQARVTLPFTSNQEAGRHLEMYCAAAGLTVADHHSLILGDFEPALILGVRAGLSASAASVLTPAELASAEEILDGATARGTFRVAVRVHAVVAHK